MPMMAITTNSSTSVKAARERGSRKLFVTGGILSVVIRWFVGGDLNWINGVTTIVGKNVNLATPNRGIDVAIVMSKCEQQ
jgi:hypothetical protein